jgi:hypothetical protein
MKLIVKIINAIIALINIIFMLLEMWSHKYALIALVISVLINLIGATWLTVRSVRKWVAARKERKENGDN